MKLTPLDIHHKEFSKSLRGYNEVEVDEFLDQVADELERLFKENIELSERIEAAEEKVRAYQEMERTLNNTLLAAQKSADDIIAKAKHEAEVVLKDAEVKAKEIIHNALQQKQKAQADLVRIKQAEEAFRAQFRALLESHLRSVAEIPLPEDVKVLAAEVGGEVVGEVEVAAAQAPAPAEETSAQRSYREALEAQIRGAAAPAEPAAEAAAEKPAAPVGEPPAPGFVQGIQLGEVAAPDITEEEPRFEVPEFKLDFRAAGATDDDLDIEEID
ncbi:MAG: DivIVA domain-containing protein [Anaerosomatales bacterium]|uniref:DivIVA domain-containing protein n=1 Tax=Parvivirga hydrogeniphila TaxID=2939460 RepID=UPI0009CF2A9E|nr:DivIVA domain-containing protein [Parvivirga hydrogeniphila]MBC7267057.1 DivIVA domain-containing protein [Coriobacteriia bacterium]MCL4079089.1 DivIVA domain-containing protein [Parvivirga hydrogeniphila]MDI6693386.1 DivIVA domain-containing protein [Anaerosomatales bacterium]GAV31448.1 cell division initiation protein [Coriobacteriaceae bacterium EMTCatB1]